MSSQQDRLNAGRVVVLRWLEAEVKDAATSARYILEPQVGEGERIRAELPDGTAVGTVTVGKAGEYATVIDERALLDWVRKNKPTEVVESVNPAYLTRLKDQVKKHGHAFDEATGEIIPGIEMKLGSPSWRPIVDKTQVPLLRSKLADIVGSGLLEIPASAEERAS